VHCKNGIRVTWKDQVFNFSADGYHGNNEDERLCYYDLLYPHETIRGRGKVVIRLAGNVVKEVIESGKEEHIPILPVGLTLVMDRELFPDGIRAGERLILSIPEYNGVHHAVEAGPLLLDNGRVAVDMKAGGWKTSHSIRTQAARLDYTKMRGPKIAVGINGKGKLTVLTINGRIRESVGATHYDMAGILKEKGLEWAMGFDPGGSSTLVVGEQVLNISPYNKKYESNVYALPPEPRAVSNAVLGYLAEDT